jgi:hypothetical protein
MMISCGVVVNIATFRKVGLEPEREGLQGQRETFTKGWNEVTKGGLFTELGVPVLSFVTDEFRMHMHGDLLGSCRVA